MASREFDADAGREWGGVGEWRMRRGARQEGVHCCTAGGSALLHGRRECIAARQEGVHCCTAGGSALLHGRRECIAARQEGVHCCTAGGSALLHGRRECIAARQEGVHCCTAGGSALLHGRRECIAARQEGVHCCTAGGSALLHGRRECIAARQSSGGASGRREWARAPGEHTVQCTGQTGWSGSNAGRGASGAVAVVAHGAQRADSLAATSAKLQSRPSAGKACGDGNTVGRGCAEGGVKGKGENIFTDISFFFSKDNGRAGRDTWKNMVTGEKGGVLWGRTLSLLSPLISVSPRSFLFSPRSSYCPLIPPFSLSLPPVSTLAFSPSHPPTHSHPPTLTPYPAAALVVAAAGNPATTALAARDEDAFPPLILLPCNLSLPPPHSKNTRGCWAIVVNGMG
ncbi:unnamed protein product [Closterium sp. NIES-65]|nr:unnamed protein product [Closterium sp. NIES-65]